MRWLRRSSDSSLVGSLRARQGADTDGNSEVSHGVGHLQGCDAVADLR